MNDPLIHIPLYLDEWHARLSGYDYLQRGAFITLFIAYVKSSGELNFEGNNSALFRACGAITNDEQKSLLEIYKEVKLFADPRIKTQEGLREKRRNNAKLGGIAKGVANAKPNAKPNAKILAEQKVSKRSAKSELELELELESKKELKEKRENNGDKSPDDFEQVWTLYQKKGNRKTSLVKWIKLKEEDKQLALSKIPAYVKSTPDKQYRKNFETWIYQECWNDEVVQGEQKTGGKVDFNNLFGDQK
jgi:hypothetical protein